jgi:signal transduction histidine kinase
MPDPHTTTPAPDVDEALRIAGLNLRSLFDQFPFAVQVFGLDGYAVYENPAQNEMWGPPQGRAGQPPVFARPELDALGLLPYIRRGFAGETVAIPSTRYHPGAIPRAGFDRPRWVRTFLYPIRDEAGTIRAVVVMHIDVTALQETQQTLERRVEERTHELATLLDVARNVASTLDLSAVLDVVLEQLKAVADYTGSTVMVAEGDSFRILDDRGGDVPNQPNPQLTGQVWPLARMGAIWQALSRREPLIIDDVRGDSPLARAFRTAEGDLLETPAVRRVRSWLAVPLEIGDRVIGFVSISKDVPGFYTEHHARLTTAIAIHAAAAIENARLYERERRTAQELATLLEVSRTATSTPELQPLLGLVLDQIKPLLDYTSAVVITRDGDGFRTREYRGPLPREVVLSRPVDFEAVPEAETAYQRGEAYMIADVWGDSEPARRYRTSMGEEYLRTTASYLRCLMIAPLMHKGEVVGGLVLTHHTPNVFTPRDAALAQAVAGQVAGAIENARLFEQEHRTAEELTTLLEVSRNLAATLDLQTLLGAIIDQARIVADYDGASVLTFDDGALKIIYRRTLGETDLGERVGVTVPLERAGLFVQHILRREALIIDDVRADEPLARAYRTMMGGNPAELPHLRYVRSWMGVPLALKDRVIGVIVLAHSTPGYYTPHHAELVTAMASQAAAAIENARLYEQAHKLAALEERQRLARELHDSVSQVLFSIGLGARTARTLLERGDADRAGSSVEYLINLAEMGTAEMRALLFELRPESLAQEGLVAAISKQAASLRARHSIEVEATLCDEPDVPLDVKEAIYRIAQEATHNTVKHARASRITVRLACGDGGVTLQVEDNGQGFDPGGAFPGHLGLRSMQERVERLGGTLDIRSAPGAGAAIHIYIPSRAR